MSEKRCFRAHFCIVRLYWAGDNFGYNKMNFGRKHAPGAGSIGGPVDLQSSALPLCYGCPLSLPRNAFQRYIVKSIIHNSEYILIVKLKRIPPKNLYSCSTHYPSGHVKSMYPVIRVLNNGNLDDVLGARVNKGQFVAPQGVIGCQGAGAYFDVYPIYPNVYPLD